MTILGWLITTHALMVKILIFALIAVAVVPNFYKNNMPKLVLWTRIGYFTFWAAWTAVVFSGLLVFAVERGKLSIAIIAMIAASVILAFLDGYRARALKKIWLKEQNGLKFSNTILLIELAIVVAVTVLAVNLK